MSGEEKVGLTGGLPPFRLSGEHWRGLDLPAGAVFAGLDFGWSPEDLHEDVRSLCGEEMLWATPLDHDQFWGFMVVLLPPHEQRELWYEVATEPARWEDDGGALWTR